MKKIGIVVAMQEEIAPFLQHYQAETINVLNYTVFKIKISDKEVFAVQSFNTGEIFAAAATQLLISHFGVEAIVNFGVVGSLTESISLHNTVLVDSVVHYHMDTTFENNFRNDKYTVGRYSCFEATEVYACPKMLEKAKKILPEIPVVRCASADKFVDSVDEKRQLAAEFGASICDMESAAILFVATQNGIPVLFVKTVSDSLTGGADEFVTNLKLAAQKHVDFIKKFLHSQ